MSRTQESFTAGIDFESILRIISKQVYETPLAFIRENVQNAVDAVRIQSHRSGLDPGDSQFRIEVMADAEKIVVRDNGIGMSADDLKNYFWTIGASGKRNDEALAAGCVGTFGIGGFANFGVCSTLEVISQTQDQCEGTLTRLSEDDIRAAGSSIPSVTMQDSEVAKPRGTVVIGQLRDAADVRQIYDYLRDFVRFVPVGVWFNGKKISQEPLVGVEARENVTRITETTQTWRHGNMAIRGVLFEDKANTLVATIEGVNVDGRNMPLVGEVRFQSGLVDVFKRGFKLCATQVPSAIGISGRLDSDRFVPTAGRDSPDAQTSSLLNQIGQVLERTAVLTVLESSDRISQHTRIFRYIVRNGLVEHLDNALVRLADGSECKLGEIRQQAMGGVRVFYGRTQRPALNQIMQARGHVVVLLSSDRYRRDAEQRFLESFCNAKAFDGLIDCIERYSELSRFEKVLLSELELSISRSYEIDDFKVIPGKLSEDIPVLLKEYSSRRTPEIFVDVRHQELAKLEALGYTQILYSLIATFCREYLGASLKKWSPRFFGDGALNLELLARRRSELWILVRDDIGVVVQGGRRHVVTRADVKEVAAADGDQSATEGAESEGGRPRILRIVDEGGGMGIHGYYLRVPDPAYSAYGDLLPSCEHRASFGRAIRSLT